MGEVSGALEEDSFLFLPLDEEWFEEAGEFRQSPR
jgi:hypothetical protein